MSDTTELPKAKPEKQAITTMGEIAAMAGVSESTVSRALSGSTLVAESTRERILKIAKAANFTVNEQARNLALGQTRSIEVVFPIEPGTLQQVSDPFFVDMLATLTDEIATHQYDVLLTKSTPWDPERPGCAFLGGRADGVVFVGQGRHRSEIRDFARAQRRVVVWGAIDDAQDYCVVGSDNFGGGFMATQHLLSLGRKSIVFLGDTTLPEIGQRFAGYRTALEAAGLKPSDGQVVDAPFDIEGARRAVAPLAAMYPAFDAIFAASDMIALAAIAALREQGVDVPRDVSVVGFDDVPAGAHVNPSLTTIRQDIKHGGKILVEKMLATLQGTPAGPETLPVELVVRESCGEKDLSKE